MTPEQTITVAQAIALRQVYERVPLMFYLSDGDQSSTMMHNAVNYEHHPTDLLTFPIFVATCQYGGDVIMVPWCGMWLGIERDGHVHS